MLNFWLIVYQSTATVMPSIQALSHMTCCRTLSKVPPRIRTVCMRLTALISTSDPAALRNPPQYLTRNPAILSMKYEDTLSPSASNDDEDEDGDSSIGRSCCTMRVVCGWRWIFVKQRIGIDWLVHTLLTKHAIGNAGNPIRLDTIGAWSTNIWDHQLLGQTTGRNVCTPITQQTLTAFLPLILPGLPTTKSRQRISMYLP